MSKTRGATVVAVVIGALGAAAETGMPYVSAFLTWTLGLPFRVLSVVFSVLETGARWIQVTALAREVGKWKRSSIDIAETTGAWFVPIEKSINQPVHDVMTLDNAIFGEVFDLIGGVLNMIAGFWHTIYKTTGIFRNIGYGTAGKFVPGINKVVELQFVGDLFKLLFGWTAAIRDFFEFSASIFAFIGGLTAIESIVFLLGLLMMTASLLVIVRRITGIAATAGVTAGLSLVFELLYGIPRFIRSSIDMLGIMGVGVGLMVWATSPLFGSFVIFAVGFGLSTVGFVEENGVLGTYGIPTMTVGLMASLAGFGVGFLGYLAVAGIFVWIYTKIVDFVNTDLQRIVEVGAV